MATTTKIKRKGGAEVKAGAQALRREEAEAKTKRRVRRGAGAEKENEAAAESATAVAPGARNDLAVTEHERAPSANVPKVGAPSKKKRVLSDNQSTI